MPARLGGSRKGAKWASRSIAASTPAASKKEPVNLSVPCTTRCPTASISSIRSSSFPGPSVKDRRTAAIDNEDLHWSGPSSAVSHVPQVVTSNAADNSGTINAFDIPVLRLTQILSGKPARQRSRRKDVQRRVRSGWRNGP